jgi:catechol 2,3-dioxygenase-like lactoylglutathione lyase family enzyme
MIGALNHLTLSVRELDRSFAFYVNVLGFRPLARWLNGAYLLAGEETWICLTLAASAQPELRSGYTHAAFSVTPAAFAAATVRIRASRAPEWQADSSEGASLYFLDPDGHKLEIHAGDWRLRLAACRARPYQGMVFY